MKNLKIVFNDSKTSAELCQLAEQAYGQFFLTTFEFARGLRRKMVNRVRIEGAPILREGLDGQQGVYILCGHIGNWEAMGAAVSTQICPARVIVKNVGSASVDRFVEAVRHANGFLSIKRTGKGDGYKQIIKTLKANEAVGFVMDQYRPNEKKVPFFGVETNTNTSFAQIWLKHPAPVIPGLIFRNSVGNHTVKLLAPLEIAPSGDKEKDIVAITQQFNSKLEEMILMNPSQYLWLHSRWKDC